jgi:lysophospholipase L1-like esterase
MKRESIFSLIGITIAVIFIEISGGVILHFYPNVEKARELLQGKIVAETSVNATPQAYLLYIPTPLFTSNNIVQNNADGYRGKAVTVERTPNSFRILFMGGSTTYGEGVEHPDDSYPAQLGKLLTADAEFSGKNIEVINAGLRWGTSAEILTHYLLKYRYYKPDLVILNPGGNDPEAYAARSYQPDYSSFRKPAYPITPLHKQAQWLLDSRFFSAFIVLMFFPDIAEGTTFAHSGENTPTQWFHPVKQGEIRLDELAFYNNIATVTREIKESGAHVFLLSYQGNPFDVGDQSQWRTYYDYEEKVLQQIGTELNAPFATYPLSRMPAELWVDPSHINEEGERRKAAYVYENIKPMLADWLNHPRTPNTQHKNFSPLTLQR